MNGRNSMEINGDNMKVLFVCKYNIGRSRMAEAFFNDMAEKSSAISKGHSAFSRGISPYPESGRHVKGLNATEEVMAEVGIKVEKHPGRGIRRKDVANADLIIILLDSSEMHLVPKYVMESGKVKIYPVPDSDDRSRDFMSQHRRARDTVRDVVKEVMAEVLVKSVLSEGKTPLHGVCPRCKQLVFTLRYHSYASVEQTCRLTSDGYMDYSEFLEIGDHIDEEYHCPYCDYLICETEEKAEKFLKGGVV
jgi:protein-tyrosine-phosphatase